MGRYYHHVLEKTENMVSVKGGLVLDLRLLVASILIAPSPVFYCPFACSFIDPSPVFYCPLDCSLIAPSSVGYCLFACIKLVGPFCSQFRYLVYFPLAIGPSGDSMLDCCQTNMAMPRRRHNEEPELQEYF